MPDSSRALVGIDVGGTFTDFVALIDDRLQIHKLPTTPDDQSRAILDGLGELGIDTADIVHGMTVATNALLERRGAATALLTTEGFADLLVLGRQNRPHLYRLCQERLPPLVPDHWRLEVSERLTASGEVLQPLDTAAVSALADRLQRSEIESLAIVFLFAFRSPAHEQQAAALIRARAPELLLSLSSEVLPEYREYERTATTVINAYVQPLVAHYLGRLEEALTRSQVRIMGSNGGAIGLRAAVEGAARVVLSGPAGGVVGAFALAQQATGDAQPHLITLDMGGTSTDVALCPGAVPVTAESTITDLPLRLPVIDIHTVGAGGGSVAYLDAGGGLHVGPRSAGAVPGPACYGRGGSEPTVTDANLILGRLDPEGFLGGRRAIRLDAAAARRSLDALGRRLGLSVEETALGVVRVTNATMEAALRRVSVERGHDPREFILLPFGGAGPLHACELADALAVRLILAPPMPGVLSAYGMLAADVVSDAAQSVLSDASTAEQDPAPLAAAFAILAERASAPLRQEGVAAPALSAALDLRYRGQSYELTVPLDLPISPAAVAAAAAAFHAAHVRRYGYAMPDEPVEVVTLRVRGSAPGPRPLLPEAPLAGADPSPARLADRPVWFSSRGPQPCAAYDRTRLRPGNRLSGPALLLQLDTTILLTPGWEAEVDRFGNLWISALLDPHSSPLSSRGKARSSG